MRGVGLPVELTIEGEPRPLPAGVDLSAYRIVQEALTNTLKHARPAQARVTVRYRSDDVELEVARRRPRKRERVARAATGSPGCASGCGCTAARSRPAKRDEGGFAVRARLPAGTGVIRVLVADDQALVRAGFRAILEEQDDLEVVGEAEDGGEAVGARAGSSGRTSS